MAKAVDATRGARKRATRISLRSFQRVLQVVGETEQGEPIVASDSSRLVLPKDGHHFRHLVRCARCGRESLGEAVLNAAHLRPQPQVFCADCAGGSIDSGLPAASEAGFSEAPSGQLLRPVAVPGHPQPVDGAADGPDVPLRNTEVERAFQDGLQHAAASLTAVLEQARADVEGHLRDELSTQIEQLITRVEAALTARLGHALEAALAARQDEHAAPQERAAFAATEASLRSEQEKVSERVGRLALRVDSSGTLLTALLLATGGRLFGRLATLAIRMSALEEELARVRVAVGSLQAQLQAGSPSGPETSAADAPAPGWVEWDAAP